MRHILAAAARAIVIGVASASMQVTAATVDHAIGTRPNVTVRDLLSLTDIGGELGAIWPAPSGRYIAFQQQRADFSANTYHSDWYIVPAVLNAVPRGVGSGGDLMIAPSTWGRLNGARRDVAAQWSPDERWIAYLRRDGNQVQVWRARVDGSGAEQVTHNGADVIRFAWRPDGKGIYFEVDRDRAEMASADRAEGARGYLIDDRLMPEYSTKPLWFPCNELAWSPRPASEPCVHHIWTVVFGSAEREATAAERKAYRDLGAPERPPALRARRAVTLIAWNQDHSRAAWLENTQPQENAGYAPPLTLFADGRQCAVPECRGHLEGVWWDDNAVLFLRREGWAGSIRSLYRWQPGAGAPRRIYGTDGGLLRSCGMGRRRLLCLLETPTKPRRIVSIDPSDGRVETIFDPNPGFARFALGHIEKIEVTDGLGHEAFGHLVYPPDYDPARRYPLVIVQYRSRGFLRGGVGNEYPIYPLAAAGFLVYSADLPEDERLDARYGMSPWKNLLAYVAHEYGKSGYRMRRALGALDAALDRLDCRAIVDPSRVGITGLSMGAEVVDYALVHSTRFAAAASSGTNPPQSYDLITNEAERELVEAEAEAHSVPEAIRNASAVSSFATHLDRIHTPLLLLLPDHELIDDLPDYVELRDAGKPVEAYVFPDEYHVKYQPLHKLAVGERVIDWFQYWLQDRETPDPQKSEQYARWRMLRKQAGLPRDRTTRAPIPRPQCTRAAPGADQASTPGPVG